MSIKMLPKVYLRGYQNSILHDFLQPDSRNAFVAARGAGKDFTGLSCADTLAMIKPGSTIGYLGTAVKSLKKIMLSNNANTGRAVYKDVLSTEAMNQTRNGDYIHKDKTNFDYKNGSLLYLLGNNPDLEVGTSMDALIITESARFPMSDWIYLIGNIRRAHGRILLISTPFYGSDFNDLIDGNYLLENGEKMDEYKIWKKNAYELRNIDGSRVYSDDYLEAIKREIDRATFRQEYMCDTQAVNKSSVLGESLQYAYRFNIISPGKNRRLYFSFDIGNSDATVMVCWYQDEYTLIPVMIDYMIKNRTNLNEFIKKIQDMAVKYKIPDAITIILPFDANADIQGYNGKINRYQEIINHVPRQWKVELVNQTNIIRALEILRRVIETKKIGFIVGEIGDFFMRILGSVNYKINKLTGRPIMEIDKRSGMYEDHPIDATKYFVIWYFQDMFEEDYDEAMIKALRNREYQELTENPLTNIPTKGEVKAVEPYRSLFSKIHGDNFGKNFKRN